MYSRTPRPHCLHLTTGLSMLSNVESMLPHNLCLTLRLPDIIMGTSHKEHTHLSNNDFTPRDERPQLCNSNVHPPGTIPWIASKIEKGPGNSGDWESLAPCQLAVASFQKSAAPSLAISSTASWEICYSIKYIKHIWIFYLCINYLASYP